MKKEISLADLKTHAEIAELVARAEKQATESRWYPVVIITAAVVATATFTKLFL